MSGKINVKVFRFTPSKDKAGRLKTYQVPLMEQMTVMDALDYIYENLDQTLSYYSHSACNRGLCGRCTMMINGKPKLACRTVVDGDLTLRPLKNRKVVKDLVVEY